MKKTAFLHILFGLLSFGLLIPNTISAATLNLSDTPLSVSTTVKPNVMLLIDNSGSMDNLVWANGYQINKQPPYPEWEFYCTQAPCYVDPNNNNYNTWVPVSRLDGNIGFWQISQTSSCNTGYMRFRFYSNNNYTYKCVKLPAPVGSDTRITGDYLNYLLNTYTSSPVDLTVLPDAEMPKINRMRAARKAAKNIIGNNLRVANDWTSPLNMRFGVSRFYGPSSYEYGHGATVDVACNNVGGHANTILNTICGSDTTNCASTTSGYLSETNTPLAEALYELTRYFRSLNSYYHSSTNCNSNVPCTPYTSPIQYRCQKNFAIVITDGFPTRDINIPTTDPDDPSGTPSLPNWDELSPPTTKATYPIFPKFSDGFQPEAGTSSADEGYSLYLDDIAKFAFDIDFKKTGNDNANISYQDPKFSKQNLRTYTVGFATANQMLEDAAEYGDGQYYTATNEADLVSSLQSALTDILAKSGSSAAATANAGFIGTDTKVYQARFNSADWSGQLLAFAIDSNPSSTTYGQPLTTPLWDAGSNSKMPTYTNRKILTIKDDATNTTTGFRGIGFSGSILTASPNPTFLSTNLQSLLDTNITTAVNMVEYLRGNSALEVNNGGTYRNRATRLGDIIYSAPVFVGAPNARYPDNLESVAYSTFKSNTSYQNRTKMIYVGANDGMLHGFHAETGVEQIAYVPGKVFGNLKLLTSPTYIHRYYVDGSPTVIDAFIGGNWKTILVGGFNKGGQGIYALDVTDPNNFSESNAASVVLWEFTDYNPTSTSRGDADLGYTYSQPAIVRMMPVANGPWAAVFGNGYNNTELDGHASTTGNAVLYIVNLQTGALIKKIDTGAGMAQDPTGANRANGLATVAPADIDGDSIADVIYAGDLFGNLWKFNVSDNNSANWDVLRVSGTPTPLFRACADATCSTTNRQPITTRPSIGRHPYGQGLIVYFGTGKFLETTEDYGSAGGKQTFYAIWDTDTSNDNAWDTNAVVSGRSVLQQQSIITEDTSTFTTPVRVTSNNTANWGTQKGWYLDLVPPSGTLEGERQITNSILRSGRIIFTTLIPTNTDPCNPGGQSWLMELNAENGSRLSYSPLDPNKDKQFSSGDYVTVNSVQVPVSGQKLTGGAATTPSPMAAEDTEMKYISTAEGLEMVMENPGPMDTGRQTWQQIGQ